MGTTSPPTMAARPYPGKQYLGLGIGLVLLGPVLCVVQFWAKILRVPWYVPALATVGAALLLFAVLQRRTVWRIAALVLAVLLASVEWYFLLSLSKLPDYRGPLATGAPFPAFTTLLADGSSFDQQSLQGEQNTAMVFFRGRW